MGTLPWDRLDIEVISLESNHVGEVFPGTQREVREYLEDKGYILATTVEIDDIFVRKDLYYRDYAPDPEAVARCVSSQFGFQCVSYTQSMMDSFQSLMHHYVIN